jgi:hypothetical protein
MVTAMTAVQSARVKDQSRDETEDMALSAIEEESRIAGVASFFSQQPAITVPVEAALGRKHGWNSRTRCAKSVLNR